MHRSPARRGPAHAESLPGRHGGAWPGSPDTRQVTARKASNYGWRNVPVGQGSGSGAAQSTPCSSASAPAGNISVADANPPEGTHPDAGAAAATESLPVPNGATKEMVALGDRVYHGQVGGATCVGCHGAAGTGTTLGPNLTDTQWLWGDGSYRSIAKTITAGVPQPKQYRSPMPPMGGAELTDDQVRAVAAYIWGLSHRAP